MNDLSAELRELHAGESLEAARSRALLLETRGIFAVRSELLVALYMAVATLIAGVGILVRENLDRIGPMALLAAILAAAALCYAIALRAKAAGRERTLGEDYVLLLGALLFSSGVGYAEVKFNMFGAAWSRHLLLLAVWHLAGAYLFGSRLLLSVALTAFAGWLGVETRLGTVFDPLHPMLRTGPRSLLCALVFYLGSRFHLSGSTAAGSGFREVYRQFAAHFAFWGALALGADADTRWIGAAMLLAMALVVGSAGLRERRESFVLYAVGYTTIGLVWLEALMLRGRVLESAVGLVTVIAAGMLLWSLRSRLKESAP